jgi:hypothetical protein
MDGIRPHATRRAATLLAVFFLTPAPASAQGLEDASVGEPPATSGAPPGPAPESVAPSVDSTAQAAAESAAPAQRPPAGPSWVPRRGVWEGSVEFLTDYSRIDTQGVGSRSRGEDWNFEERVTIRNRGIYVLSPQLLTMNVGFSYGLTQEKQRSEVGGETFARDGDGTLIGYEFFASALPGRRVSLDVNAYRNESSIGLDFASDTDILLETYGATLRLPYLSLPSTIGYRHEHTDAETRSFGVPEQVAKQEERRDVIEYHAERGWENKEVGIDYEFLSKDDRVDSQFSYDAHRLNLRFGADTGVELNRHWYSSLRLYSREGFSPEDRIDFEQNLRVDHSDTLRSRYRYYLTHTRQDAGDTTTQNLQAYLEHQLRENLYSEIGAEAERDRTDVSDQDIYRGRVRFDYRKDLPASGRLLLGLADTYEWERDRFDDQRGLALDEALGFGDPALPRPLANRSVDEVIEVRKVRSGPIPIGCVAFTLPRTLVEGVDYGLQTTGNLTEIVPLPCSPANPGINPGDVIEVDYRFSAPGPSITFTTSDWRFLAALEYPFIRPYYEHDERDQSLESGVDDGFLVDERRDRFGVELRLDRTPYFGSVRLERESYDSTDLAYTTERIGGYAAFPVGSRSRLSLVADSLSTDYSDPGGRRSRFLSARATLTTAFERGLFVDTYLAHREIEDTLVPDEDLDEAGVQVRWRMGKFALRSNLRYVDRTRGDVETDDWRVTFHVERRF